MFQVLRQQFVGTMSHKLSSLLSGQGQSRTVASDWAIMGERPVLHQDNFENAKYFQCNKHRPNKNRIGWICHKYNKRIDPNKTV